MYTSQYTTSPKSFYLSGDKTCGWTDGQAWLLLYAFMLVPQATDHFELCNEVTSHLYIVRFRNGIHLACSQGIQIHH